MSPTGEKSGKSAEAVFALSRPSRCYSCDTTQNPGDLVRLKPGADEQEVLCRNCAGLASYVVIPAGNARLTRAAKKHANKCYVIMKWSELWKCYERQGLLIDGEAVAAVESELGVKVR